MTLAIRRSATVPFVLAATALLCAPSAAMAASGPGGGPRPPAPKPAGPVQTVTKVHAPKTPTAARPLTLSARVGLVRRGRPGAVPAETGTVLFTVDGTPAEPVALKKGRASEKVKLAPGKHTVDAKYSGDAAHEASDSGPVTLDVK